MLFNVIPDAIVITRSKGVFNQRKVYVRKGYIYVAFGSGFIRLMSNGTNQLKMTQSKQCIICQTMFNRPLGLSDKVWNKRQCCCNNCSAISRRKPNAKRINRRKELIPGEK